MTIKYILASLSFMYSLFIPNNFLGEAKTIDPLAKAIENVECSNMAIGWFVSSSGEWKDGMYIITITCEEGGNKPCPQPT